MSYGFDNLREACISEKRGKNIKEDSLFLSFYDYWTMINAVITFDWSYPEMYILEKHILRKIFCKKLKKKINFVLLVI